MEIRIAVALATASAALGAGLVVRSPLEAQQRPADYEQILPRGAIASIDDPEWVRAERATIPDDAFVLGMVIDGEARAFSINLLNHHEIVNDTIGETAYAAVW